MGEMILLSAIGLFLLVLGIGTGKKEKEGGTLIALALALAAILAPGILLAGTTTAAKCWLLGLIGAWIVGILIGLMFADDCGCPNDKKEDDK